jgi:hypothetical protein
MSKLQPALCVVLLATLGQPSLLSAATDPACPFSETLPPSDLLIGYIGNGRHTNGIRLGSFRVLAIIRNGTLVTSEGEVIREGMEVWNVLAPSAPPVALRQVSSHLDRLGKDHCVFHAEPETDLALWTLLTNRPAPGIFHQPSPSETAYFTKHHNLCIDQGDYEPSSKPPCARPRLLAVSDLNQNGEKEYWATEPYTWDTGITVWKHTESGLALLQAKCSGCSD